MKVRLKGEDSSVQVISRSVAQDESVQVFNPLVIGESACRGHVQCDAIIMGQAKVKAIPGIEAASEDARLIHEAAIGKIAGDQIVALMTLGLTEEEAEAEILDDFLVGGCAGLTASAELDAAASRRRPSSPFVLRSRTFSTLPSPVGRI